MSKAVTARVVSGDYLIEVRDLVKYFPIRRGVLSKVVGQVHAVDHVSFGVREGETFGLVGESGCGKSTTCRLILRLIEPTLGEVTFAGQDLLRLDNEGLRKVRREMQIVFQDPFSSLNARMRVGQIISEPLVVHGIGSASERKDRVTELLRVVGLRPGQADNLPHQFSGGERQRIGIARALALQPRFIIADEPVSALDVSIQSQVINLLQDLQRDFNLTYLFIAHDLSVVKHMCDRIGVMYLGKLVETAPKKKLFDSPGHPYTQALLGAILAPNPSLRQRRRQILEGDVPSPVNPPGGCRFHTRCKYAEPICLRKVPELIQVGEDHWVACHGAQKKEVN